MNFRWHKVELKCPKCGNEPAIMTISTSADGEILVDMVCATCGIPLKWLTTGSQMLAKALSCDIEEAQAKDRIGNKPLRPPTKMLPPPNVKKADHDFLHDLGIDDEEGK